MFSLKTIFNYKFVKDSAYTFASFIFIALSGIIVNVLIGNNYEVSSLGIFNQSVAIYMIFSILSVLGLNTSVVKYIAQYNQDKKTQKEIFTTAFILTLCFSLFITSFLLFLAYLFPVIYFNKDVTKATIITLFSLPFLSLNKIFMALQNALRHMKAYSIVQSVRWLIILGFIFISIILNKSFYFLMYTFLFSELLIFIYFILFYSDYFSIKAKYSSWYKKNFNFGIKSVLLGFLSEIYNKIDIFLIGFLLSNYYVGIYSFAAEIAKGLLLVGSIIQLNINPIVSNLTNNGDIATLKKYTLSISKLMYLIIIPIIFLAAFLFPLFINLFMSEKAYLESIPIFYILLPGVFILSVYYFAGAYLTMANYLNESFIILAIVLIYNTLTCILFITLFGFWGAAISTSTTYILLVLLFHYFIKKKMNIPLINLNL